MAKTKVTKTKVTKKKSTAPRKPPESKKTAEGFREGSLRDLAVKALREGKTLSAEALVKKVGGNLSGRSPAVFIGPVIKDLRAAGIQIQSTDEGYKLGKGGSSSSAPSKKSDSKKSSESPKEAKKITSPPQKKKDDSEVQL